MLTIENFHRNLIGKGPNSKKWFCGGIEETETQYRIAVANNHNIGFEMSLERNPIGQAETALYELWYWDKNGNVQRSLLTKDKINTKRKMVKRITELIIK